MKFSPAWTIQRKRDGEELSPQEIREFIAGLQSGEVADYQATAFLMATYFNGMTLQETAALTQAMLESGERYDLSSIKGAKVDKHSTGGVGDKVSIILAPLAAACGLKVPMMAGRGLGYSGGTIDKLEAIPGFNTCISASRFAEIIEDTGCAIIGQSEKVAPADRKLYALRDVTATIECVPLITASILSKKLAEGTDALILDLKVGNGAFMKTREKARKLAKVIVQVAKKMNLPCRAILTNMDQPLGYAVGNALEITECIEVLKNEKKDEFSSIDLKELTLQLCAHMLVLGKVCKSLADGRKLAHARLADGSAWKLFQAQVKAQGGDLTSLPEAPLQLEWKSRKRGYLTHIDTEMIGRLLIELGGGRKKAADTIDPSVGILFHRKLSAKLQPGDTIVTVHAPSSFSTKERMAEIETALHEAFEITAERKPVTKLILEAI